VVKIVHFGCAAAGLLSSFAVDFVIGRSGIHSLEQTPAEITLTGVSRDFVHAVDAWREARAERLASHSGRRTTSAEELSATRDSRDYRPAPNIAQRGDLPA
jgi:hypothetical protein